MPSLYLGGLTIALALSSLAIRHGPPWRVWFTVIVVVSLLGSLGQYTSPIWWLARWPPLRARRRSRNWLPDLGPIDPVDTTPIRLDGYLRDGDGGFYWWLATVLPGFRQFRFPAKLFTFTALAMAALAGLGWDRLSAGRPRRTAIGLLRALGLDLAALAGVVFQREPILASFRASKSPSMFGPFDAAAGYRAIIRSLGQAAIVFGLGLVLTVLARRRPRLAGSAALIVMTADLAAANSRYILTVPQSVFETKPEVLKIIEDAERADPSPGPFRIHRMPLWYPLGWRKAPSKDRIIEIASWERDTLQPKHGINLGVEYTHTLGSRELDDYDRYFTSFFWTVRRQAARPVAGRRRSARTWSTIPAGPTTCGTPATSSSRSTPTAGATRSRAPLHFCFRASRSIPIPTDSPAPTGRSEATNWIETRDFRVIRNLDGVPSRLGRPRRARQSRHGLLRRGLVRAKAMQEILYAADPIWNDATQRVYDPHDLAWVARTTCAEIRPYLSGQTPRPSETVKVTYPNPQQAVLEVNLESPGLVILADVYYPGWELTIDGKPAPIYRVNGSMRGAAVPSGPHRLVYTLCPIVVSGRPARIDRGPGRLVILAWHASGPSASRRGRAAGDRTRLARRYSSRLCSKYEKATAAMRLAFSTNAYLKYPFDEAASRIAALGYEGLELLADVPHAWPAGLLDVQKRAILQAMERSRPGVFQHQRVHDERDQRPPPALLASVVHRARAALPPGPDRPHQDGRSTSAPSSGRPISPPSRAARWRRDSRGKRPSTSSSKS